MPLPGVDAGHVVLEPETRVETLIGEPVDGP